MAFLTGLILIDAPASALNNAGGNESRTENVVEVKHIRTRQGAFPYVSAQAFRYWLRSTLDQTPELGWKSAPVFREAKIAYTDANPIEYWDDDLLGYMRAASKKPAAKEARKADAKREGETPTSTEITRISPFRVSTLVSIAPVSITSDFGTMTRHEGDPVPHEHQFYRAVLKGLVSLNLRAAGTFSYANRTGYRNLDDNRVQLAQDANLEILEKDKAYRLSRPHRTQRVCALLRAMGLIYGGAKFALHYTDVTPAVFLGMITKGGNNPLQYLIAADDKGLPAIQTEALKECLTVWRDQIQSKLYVGWVRGFHNAQSECLRDELQRFNNGSEGENKVEAVFGHPREVLDRLAADLADPSNSSWLE